jgi:hypothetical protein
LKKIPYGRDGEHPSSENVMMVLVNIASPKNGIITKTCHHGKSTFKGRNKLIACDASKTRTQLIPVVDSASDF